VFGEKSAQLPADAYRVVRRQLGHLLDMHGVAAEAPQSRQ
jgi:hypothetical protein